jgi:hypothetical protein
MATRDVLVKELPADGLSVIVALRMGEELGFKGRCSPAHGRGIGAPRGI